jgi:hypothetical protein
MLTLTLVFKTLKPQAYNPTPLRFKNSIQQKLKLGELIIEKHLCLVPSLESDVEVLCLLIFWDFVNNTKMGMKRQIRTNKV